MASVMITLFIMTKLEALAVT